MGFTSKSKYRYTMELDLTKTCRTCMKAHENLITLFGGVQISYNLETVVLSDILRTCTEVEVAEGDALPQYICSICSEKLAQAYIFRLSCQNTDKKFRKLNLSVETRPSSEDLKSYKCLFLRGRRRTHDDEGKPISIDDKSNLNDTFSKSSASIPNQSEHEDDPPEDEPPEDAQFRNVVKEESEQHVVDQKPPVCKTCGKLLNDRQRFKAHMRLHTVQKPHVCKICNTRSVSAVRLNSHMSAHKERPLVCACGRRFAESTLLGRHMKTHTTRFTCGYCRRSFRSVNLLRLHERQHLGIKLHRCKICSKDFFDQKNLRKHIHVHEEPHLCKVCGREFQHLCTLKRHVNTHLKNK